MWTPSSDIQDNYWCNIIIFTPENRDNSHFLLGLRKHPHLEVQLYVYLSSSCSIFSVGSKLSKRNPFSLNSLHQTVVSNAKIRNGEG